MRMRSLTLLLTSALATTAAAQPTDFDAVEVKTTRLGDHVAMLQGAGGNLVVCFGDDGVVLVDDEYAPMAPKVRAAVAELGAGPIRFVLNTHWHGDHTGGNEALGESGAIIVAHENVRTRLASDQFVPFFDKTVPASPPAALPLVTFADGVSLHLNGGEIAVEHVKNAHTDGDAIVWFRDAKVVHAGDTVFNGFYPYIDSSSGGSVAGMIAATDRILAGTDASWKIVPGHGPLADRAALERYRAMLVGTRDAVAAAKASGKSMNEVVAAKPTAAWDEAWGGGFLSPERYVAVLYDAIP